MRPRKTSRVAVTRRTVLQWGTASSGLAVAGSRSIRPARAQALQKVIIAVSTAPIEPNHHYWLHAKSQGYYKEVGIDVEIKSIQGEVNALRAVLAGDADIGTIGAYSTLSAVNAGARIKCIGAFTPHLDSHIGARKSIATLKDLEGKSFAVSGIGNISQVGPMLCMEQAGGDPRKVQWAAVASGSGRVQGLIAGAFEATAFNTVYVKRVASYDHLHVLTDQGKTLPYFLNTWEVASAAIFAKKALLMALIAATARGARWAMENPADAAKVSQDYLPEQPKEDVLFQLETYARNKHWVVDGVLPREYWDFTTTALLSHKLVEQVPRYEDFVVNDFALAAREKLRTVP
jgi:NitT/TauT family transport system substrate-binding protein